jgi:hypothetical protein
VSTATPNPTTPVDPVEPVEQRYQKFIREQTEENMARTLAAGPEAISRRLMELDREWDAERFLGTGLGLVGLTGLFVAVLANWWFLLIPTVTTLFLFLHAVNGWHPPVAVRWFGFRTSAEIDYERYALKALRGDFDSLRTPSPVPTATHPAEEAQAREALHAVDK